MNILMSTSGQFAPVFVRLALGAVMFPHGAQKALGWFGGNGLSATVQYFEANLGVAPALTYLVVAAEFLGAIGLMLGFLTRLAALGVIAVMVGAVKMVHINNGFFMDWNNAGLQEGYEYHILAIGMALALVVTGAGRWSIDRHLSAG